MLSIFVLVHVLIFVCSVIDTRAATKNIGHVVLIASPFFGHIIPILDLAKRLSAHHHVTYIVSAAKLDALKQRGFLDDNSGSSQSRLEIIGLRDGNNVDIEVSNVGTNTEIQALLDRMREPLLKLLFPASSSSSPSLATHSIGRPIDLIITDMFLLPPVQKAYEKNITTYLFIQDSLLTFTRYLNTSRGKIENGELALNFDRQMQKAIPLVKGLICNSALEIDERVLHELRQQSVLGANIPILFVAPLTSENSAQKQSIIIVAFIKQWLDTQWERANRSPSVIYVAFGSWACLQAKQLVQISRALMPYPFIWSLQTKWQGFVSASGIDNQKHLLLDWTPQRFILSHPAIRLFISHSGWNSMIESMSAGKPLLAWPLFGTQFSNGYRLEHEFGMGRCIENTDLTKSERIISSDELTQYLKEMFNQETKYVRKAREVQQMMLRAKENSSRLFFEELVKTVDNQVTVRLKKHNEL